MNKNYDEIGPIHPWLPDAMKLKLNLEGDQIQSSVAEFGYLSRNIEKKVMGESFVRAQRFLSHLEPESAPIIDKMLCECVESLVDFKLNERAAWAREIAQKISEVSSLLRYLTFMSKRMGLTVLNHIILKHREELLDLLELLTGSRYGYFYTILGGVRYDVTEGFIERIEAWVMNLKKDFSRIEAMFLWTHVFQNRLADLGKVIDSEKNAFLSASSVETSRFGMVSNVESRLIHALQKTKQESEALFELVSLERKDEYVRNIDLSNLKAHENEASQTSQYQSSRGLWSVSLKLNHKTEINGLELVTPSQEMISYISPALEHESYDDIPIILQSLNFLVTEVDR